jgi:DHA1 family bicyclomycin/chloramphenicol resistance-like MFS transporter
MSRPALQSALATPRSARSEVALILVLGALTAFAPLAIDTYLPAFSAIARDLDTRPDQVDWTLAIYFLGLAAGQLVLGPIADRVGRRGPLRVGLAVFVASSIAAALAPSLGFLIAARGVQALGGAACGVTARAVVRDLYRGAEAARVNSRIVLVMGAAPIIAPLLGAALLRATGWRSIFGMLAAIAAIAYVVVRRVLPETATAPRTNSLAASLRALVADRDFVGFALIAAMASCALFAYISGAPVIFIAIHGVAPSQFSWLFGGNAAAYIAMSQLNARLLRSHAPRTLLTVGVCGLAVAGAILSGSALAGLGPIATELGCIALLASLGFVFPNAVALALEHQGHQAGNAAAWLGALQFGLSAVASSAVAALTDATALPTAATVLIVALVACALRAWTARHAV